MRVALVWPKSTFLIDPMYYPPLGLWHVWRALEQAGAKVDYFDLEEDEDWFLLNLEAHRFDQVWVSGTTPQAAMWRTLGPLIQRTGTRAVFGGPHAWLKGQEELEYFDLVVKGEVLDRYKARQVLHAPDGFLDVGLRDNLTGVATPIRRAAWRYHAKLQGVPCTTMMTSFGCPYHCAFCSSPDLWDRKVRYFPMVTMAEDVRAIRRMGFGAVQFYDDILPIRPKRTLALAEMLRKEDLIWRCFMRSDLGVRHGLDFLVELHRLGLREVLVGVESSSQKIKDNVSKGTTVEQDTLLRQWCEMVGISYKASIILGLPGETQETMEETRTWLLVHRPDRVDVNVLIPMPGTPLYDNAERYDCHWTEEVPDEYFFKGRPGELACLVETKALAPEEILGFRNALVEELSIPY